MKEASTAFFSWWIAFKSSVNIVLQTRRNHLRPHLPREYHKIILTVLMYLASLHFYEPQRMCTYIQYLMRSTFVQLLPVSLHCVLFNPYTQSIIPNRAVCPISVGSVCDHDNKFTDPVTGDGFKINLEELDNLEFKTKGVYSMMGSLCERVRR